MWVMRSTWDCGGRCFFFIQGGLKRIMELSFPRTFAPGSESSIGGTFAPWNWNFRSRERKWRGTFAPQHELSVTYTDFKKAFEFSPTILELHVRKKLKAHASSTKSQQLCALKYLFYTALQIMLLFVYWPIVSTVFTMSSLLASRHFWLQSHWST